MMDATQTAPALAPPNDDLPKAEDDLRFLLGCFREVLQELGEDEIARVLPAPGAAWRRSRSATPPAAPSPPVP